MGGRRASGKRRHEREDDAGDDAEAKPLRQTGGVRTVLTAGDDAGLPPRDATEEMACL